MANKTKTEQQLDADLARLEQAIHDALRGKYPRAGIGVAGWDAWPGDGDSYHVRHSGIAMGWELDQAIKGSDATPRLPDPLLAYSRALIAAGLVVKEREDYILVKLGEG